MTDQLTDFLDTAPSERADRVSRMNETQFDKHIEQIIASRGAQRRVASALSVRPRSPK